MTLNKMKLTYELSRKMKCRAALARKFINALQDVVLENIAQGNDVMIGSIGKIGTFESKERIGVNPSNKKKMTIPAKLRPKFKAYMALYDAIDQRSDNEKIVAFDGISSMK
jgi:DNA-binding protein HU-beta